MAKKVSMAGIFPPIPTPFDAAEELDLKALAGNIEKWNKTLEEMLKDPEVVSNLRKIGASPFYHDTQQSREFVLKEKEQVAILWGLK